MLAFGVLSVIGNVAPVTIASAQVVSSPDPINPPLVPDLPTAMPFTQLPGVSLPPPSSSVALAASAAPTTPHVDAPLPPPDPTEGWTTSSHWKADGTGHVTAELYTGVTFRQDAQGWHKIDSTLHPRADLGQPVSAENALVPIRFGSDASRAVELELPGGPVTISANGLQVSTPQLGNGNSVQFNNVADSTDVTYKVLGDGGFKESVVLRAPTAPTSFSFYISDPSGQLGTPHAIGPNGPFIFDRPVAPKTFLGLGEPYAFEQSHEMHDPSSAHMTVVQSGSGYLITESVDETWLRGKQYPIVLDPTVWYPTTIGNSYNDPHVVEYYVRADFSNGGGCQYSCTGGPGGDFIDVGSVAATFGPNYNNWIDRAVFRYDFSTIPPGSQVQSGVLNLTNTGCDGQGSGGPCPTVDPTLFFPYTAPFPLNGASAQTIFNNTGSNQLASQVPCNAIGPGKCTMSVDLTNQIGRWVSGADLNYGFVAKGQSEGGNTGGPVWSSTYMSPTSTLVGYPYLSVTYSAPPSVPGNVTASATSSTSATVSWTAASAQNGDAIAGYTITTYSSPGGTQVGSPVVCGSGSCTSQLITGLTPGSSYFFTVYASNDWTSGPTAQSNTITLSAPPTLTKTVTGSTNLVPGQTTTFQVQLSSPSGTTTLTSLTDQLPSGFVFGNAALGGVSIASPGVSGVPSTCPAAQCSLSETALTLNFGTSPVSIPQSKSITITYPVVAIGDGRGCFSVVNTVWAVTTPAVPNSQSPTLTTCESDLGFENYWQYVTRSLGGGGKAAINPAGGNLVVQQDDFTPIQAHGRLAFVLRRTYNSGDTAIANLPGSLGSGWQFNVSESEGVLSDAAGASGLYLPNAVTIVGSPFAVTLIDRDGTRHVYQPNALTAAVDVQSINLVSGVTAQDIGANLATLYPLALSLAKPGGSYQPRYQYDHICVDQTFTPPAGVHMALWRYIAVQSTGSGSACTPFSGTSAVIAGYGAETTDRVHYEFSADGHLLVMADASGNQLQYTYGTPVTGTQNVTQTLPYPDAGPFSVPMAITEPSTGRKFAFMPTWNGGNQINGFQVTDPAARTTTYKFDGQFPNAHLTEVDNPDGSTLVYAYGTSCAAPYGAATGAAANQMCSDTHHLGNTSYVTYFTYTTTSADGYTYPSLPRANAITDMRESGVTPPANRQDTTVLTYHEPAAPTLPWVTADQAGHRQRFLNIDGFGRVAEVDEGTTGDVYTHQTRMTWDGNVDYQTGPNTTPANQPTYCRQPDAARDNNLCHVVRVDTGGAAPDDNVSRFYDDEGQLVATDQCLGAASSNPTSLPPCPTTLDTTSGYQAQYFETTGGVVTAADSLTGYNATTGHGAVSSASRPAALTTLFAVIDKTASVPPRGNASGSSYTTYQTTYTIDTNTGVAPSTKLSGGVCPGNVANTGLLCKSDGPAFDSSGAPTETQYTYENHGQRATMTTPLAVNKGGASYSYTYYPDTGSDTTQTRDLSNTTSQGGWLKAVTDPTGAFVAYAYDAAGNRVRVWDRDATQNNSVAVFPGTAAGSPGQAGGSIPCAFTETRYASGTPYGQCPSGVSQTAYANPWRYALFQRDQLGNATTFQVDLDGNVTVTRPPRGNQAGNATYDVTQAFDANDNLTCSVKPVEAVGTTCASPPATATTYAYDAFNNRTQTKDPRGHYTVDVYDTVNRAITHWFSRGPLPTQSQFIPAGCHQAGQSGDPSIYGSGTGAPMICATQTSYDYVDNITSTQDANAQTATTTYDSVHRKTQQITPRDTGVTEKHAWLYDADGHVTDDCSPREFTEGVGSCTSTGAFSTHKSYDASGRASTVTTTGQQPPVAQKTASIYDANGNVVEVCSPREFSSEGSNACGAQSVFASFTSYDLLDRRLSVKTFRSSTVSETTSYAYDPAGNVLTVYQPGSQVSGDGSAGALTIDGAQYPQTAPYVLTSTANQYTTVTLQNGGWLTVPAWNGTSGGVVTFVASGAVTICATCGIMVTGLGSAGGAGGTSAAGAAGSGPGGGGGGRVFSVNGVPTSASSGGGAGHASTGAPGAASLDGNALGGSGGSAYGATDLSDGTNPVNVMGSGGGGGASVLPQAGGNGGHGGGYVHISAASINVQGVIHADGTAGGGSTVAAAGGGGSGGSVWLSAPSVTLACCSAVTVAGGAGGTGVNNLNGGQGYAGRVRIDSDPPAGAGTGWGSYNAHYSSILTSYSYDADNRTVDTVQAADNPIAGLAGPATQAKNVRTRAMYDPDGHVVAQFEPRAFVSSTTTPDPVFMTRVDFDADGRPTAQYAPRYDNTNDGGVYSDMGLSSNSSTQGTQCSTGATPQSVSGVPTYSSTTAVCITRLQYDATGNRSQVSTPTIKSDATSYTQMAYTDDSLVASVSAPDPSHPGSRLTAMTYDYDGAARPLRTTDANGIQMLTSYFGDGLVKSTTAVTTSHVTTYGYDANGNQTSMTDPVGNVTTTVYNADNRKKSVQDGAGDLTTYGYDGGGNTTVVTSPSANAHDVTNSAGVATRDCFTPDNLLTMTLTPVPSGGTQLRQTTYAYDAAGRKLQQQIQLVAPPPPGTPCAVQSGTSGGSQTFVYLDDGRMQTQIGRNGETIGYAYDAAGNMTSGVDSTSGVTLASTFYTDGATRSVDDGARTTKFAYDGVVAPTVRVEAVDNSSTQYTSTYVYGAAELPASMTSTTVQNTPATTWTYDAGGRPISEVYPNTQTLAISYTSDNLLATQTLKKPDGTIHAQWTYTYDGDFRITGQQFTGKGTGSATANKSTLCYSYDQASRLNGFQVLASGACGTVPTNSAHDHDGNRTTFTSASGTQSAYCYNADDSMSSSQPAAAPNCTTPPSGSKSLVYAPFGGIVDDGCATYAYDGFDRLTQVIPKSGCTSVTAASYTYDALDRQYSHSDGGSTGWLHYDGLSNNVAIETSNAGVDTTYELGPAGQRRAFTVHNGSLSQYLTDDGQGNISTVTTGGSSQAMACTLRFDPFGNPIGALSATNPCNTGGTANDFFYRAGRRDAASGDYQFGARTYDPSKSAFLTPDKYLRSAPAADLSVGTDPLTANRYNYVNGDPVNLIDPNGHCARNPDDPSVYQACARQESQQSNQASSEADVAYRQRGVLRHLLDVNDRSLVLLHTSVPGLDINVDLTKLHGTSWSDVVGACTDCSGTRITSGCFTPSGSAPQLECAKMRFAWDARALTWVCGMADAPGSSCDESTTYVLSPLTGMAEQYDDKYRVNHWHELASTGAQLSGAASALLGTCAAVAGLASLVTGPGAAAVAGACGGGSLATGMVATALDFVAFRTSDTSAESDQARNALAMDFLAFATDGLMRAGKAGALTHISDQAMREVARTGIESFSSEISGLGFGFPALSPYILSNG